MTPQSSTEDTRSATKVTSTTFPTGFLWGASTAPHQNEGNNTTSDFWALEQLPGSVFSERSGDALALTGAPCFQCYLLGADALSEM